MVDFNEIRVNRLIIHTIHQKKDGEETATAQYSNTISSANVSIMDLIRTRLRDAAGKGSKAFYLDIENVAEDSFYGLSNGLNDLDDVAFIERTADIAHLLASCQRRSNIPGGYLLLLDCINEESGWPVCIVIKAEPHEALLLINNDEGDQLRMLDEVFLSPSQKLYKIGIIYKKEDLQNGNPGQEYGGFLYDNQFRTESHPAEYFYKCFLGFTVGSNPKIQSHNFFEKTELFILSRVSDPVQRGNLLGALKTVFFADQNSTLNPSEFAHNYISNENGLLDSYIGEVCSALPHSFVKSDELIKSKLNKRRIGFPDKINIAGPEEYFDRRVEIVGNDEDLDGLSASNPLYTIVKIYGKPYSSDE